VLACRAPAKTHDPPDVNWPALIEKLGPTLVISEIEPAGDAGPLMTEAHDRSIDDDILCGDRAG